MASSTRPHGSGRNARQDRPIAIDEKRGGDSGLPLRQTIEASSPLAPSPDWKRNPVPLHHVRNARLSTRARPIETARKTSSGFGAGSRGLHQHRHLLFAGRAPRGPEIRGPRTPRDKYFNMDLPAIECFGLEIGLDAATAGTARNSPQEHQCGSHIIIRRDSRMRIQHILVSLAILGAAVPARAQSVISTHSGLILSSTVACCWMETLCPHTRPVQRATEGDRYSPRRTAERRLLYPTLA